MPTGRSGRPAVAAPRARAGDFLDGHFAGGVAPVARLHAAIGESGADVETTDRAGRLPHAMGSRRDGAQPRPFPARARSSRRPRAVGSRGPAVRRYLRGVLPAEHLGATPAEAAGRTVEQREEIRAHVRVPDHDAGRGRRARGGVGGRGRPRSTGRRSRDRGARCAPEGARGAGPVADAPCQWARPMTRVKVSGSSWKPRTPGWKIHSPESLRTNSAMVAAVASCTEAKSSSDRTV